MTAKLTQPIRREVVVDGEPMTVIISPNGVRLSKKRFRSGAEMSWKALWEGNRNPVVGGHDEHGVTG